VPAGAWHRSEPRTAHDFGRGVDADMDEDETLVVAIGEFGRSPRISAEGRDHWPQCYTALLAGAGIRGGTVYGASDAHAAFVRDNPVSPADICATIYECLGIDSNMLVYDRARRPISVAQGGREIREVLA